MTGMPAGIYRIPLPTPLPVGDVNAYLLTGTVPTLVDPGPYTPEAYAALCSGLERVGFSLPAIRQIVITHPHVDHYGLARMVAEESGAVVVAHQEAVAVLNNPAAAVQKTVRLLMDWGRGQAIPPELLHHVAWGHQLWTRVAEPVTVQRPLAEGEDLLAGSDHWQVLYTPGHSSGHICLWRESDGALISGDHLLPGVISSPLLEPAGGSSHQRIRSGAEYVSSLSRLALLQLGTVFPGHGPAFTGATTGEILRRIGKIRRQAEALYTHLHGGPRTLWELTRLLFPRVHPDKLIFALSNVAGYLDLLAVQGYTATTTDRQGVQRVVGLEPLAMAGD